MRAQVGRFAKQGAGLSCRRTPCGLPARRLQARRASRTPATRRDSGAIATRHEGPFSPICSTKGVSGRSLTARPASASARRLCRASRTPKGRDLRRAATAKGGASSAARLRLSRVGRDRLQAPAVTLRRQALLALWGTRSAATSAVVASLGPSQATGLPVSVVGRRTRCRGETVSSPATKGLASCSPAQATEGPI